MACSCVCFRAYANIAEFVDRVCIHIICSSIQHKYKTIYLCRELTISSHHDGDTVRRVDVWRRRLHRLASIVRACVHQITLNMVDT